MPESSAIPPTRNLLDKKKRKMIFQKHTTKCELGVIGWHLPSTASLCGPVHDSGGVLPFTQALFQYHEHVSNGGRVTATAGEDLRGFWAPISIEYQPGDYLFAISYRIPMQAV